MPVFKPSRTLSPSLNWKAVTLEVDLNPNESPFWEILLICHQEIGEEKIMHYNHWMQWIMVYMTRYWISTLHKTYSRDYNGLSFPHQFPDGMAQIWMKSVDTNFRAATLLVQHMR